MERESKLHHLKHTTDVWQLHVCTLLITSNLSITEAQDQAWKMTKRKTHFSSLFTSIIYRAMCWLKKADEFRHMQGCRRD